MKKRLSRKDRTTGTKMTNAVEPAAPASVWGHKGCVGKGGKTLNSKITEQKESE